MEIALGRPVVLPPRERWTGRRCAIARARWWIRAQDVVKLAGITASGFDRWEAGNLPSNWPGAGPAYDAMLDLIEQRAKWVLEEIRQLKAMHRNV